MEFDPKKTACLTLDLQQGILANFPAPESVLLQAAKVVEYARKKQFLLIHVGLGFREGYPEVHENSMFAGRLKQLNAFVKGTPSVEFHKSVYRPQDLVVYKQRIGGFSENELHMILRAHGIENLIFFGVATSGIVLSTIRRAFDLDYRCVVVKDACFDRDPEVHQVLTEKVFPNQGTVVTAAELVGG